MENELIKLDFLKLDLLNSDRGYSTDNYSTYSEDAPSPSLSSSTQSRDKSEVDINKKIQLKKEKTSQGMCDKINRQVQFFLWMGTVKVL